ncbi:titin-like isoform X2 [Corticium candelabrum]|uniref:titin-like isoform X2 n=1 Tax=Corticium candelabrum TaxID=121492 RepID=UPI002E273A65|nr:titin-like isoform X2 [Corticium candelabrum]
MSKIPVQPGPPTKVKIVSFTATTARLKWEKGFDGHSQISGYKLEYKIGTSVWQRFPGLKIPPSTEFVVENLVPNTSYKFRIKAFNDVGSSVWSKPSLVITTETQDKTDSLVISGADTEWPHGTDGANKSTLTPKSEITGMDRDLASSGIQTPIGVSDKVGVTESMTMPTQSTSREQNTVSDRVSQVTMKPSQLVTPTIKDDLTTIQQTTESPNKVQPKPPTKLEIVSFTATTAHLKWEKEFDGHSQISGYKLEYKIGTSAWQRFPGLKIPPSTEFVVENLVPNTSYKFRIKAFNDVGSSVWSKPSLVITTKTQDDETDSLVISGADTERPHGTDGATKPTSKSKIRGTDRDLASSGILTPIGVSDKISVTESTTQSTSREGNTVSDRVSQVTMKPSQLATHTRKDDLTTIQQTTENPQKVQPGPPIQLKIVSFTATTAHLKWEKGFDGHSRISGYKLEYKIGMSAWQRFPGLKIPSLTEYVVENLVPNTNYKFRIKAFNDVGSSVWSKPSLVITTKTQDDKTESLVISGADTEWPHGTDGATKPTSKSKIRGTDRDLASSGIQTPIGVSDKISVTESTTQSTSREQNTVSDRVSQVTMKPSQLVTHTIKDDLTTIQQTTENPNKVQPKPPTQLKIVSFTATTAHLKWEKGFDGHSRISGYKLEYKIGTSAWQRFPGLKIPSSTEFVVENLVPNTNYKFRIKAFNDVGSSVWSKPSLVITTKTQDDKTDSLVISGADTERPHGTDGATKPTSKSKIRDDLATIQQTTENPQKVQPKPPTKLEIVSFTATTAHLKWEKGFDGHSQISGYKLEYKIGTSAWQRFPGLKIPPSTEFVVDNLVPNTSYKFRIKAFNDVGSSVWSKPSLVIATKTQDDKTDSLVISGADTERPYGTDGATKPSSKSKITGTGRDLASSGIQTPIGVSDKISVTESTTTMPTQSTSREGNTVSDRVSQVTMKTSQLVTQTIKDDLTTIQQTTENPNKVQPGPPAKLKIVSFTATTARLRWEKGFDGHSQISGYKLEYKIGTSAWQRFPGLKIPPSTEFVVENLVPNTSYKFRIKAFNDVGSSVWSKPTLVITTKTQVVATTPPESSLSTKQPHLSYHAASTLTTHSVTVGPTPAVNNNGNVEENSTPSIDSKTSGTSEDQVNVDIKTLTDEPGISHHNTNHGTGSNMRPTQSASMDTTKEKTTESSHRRGGHTDLTEPSQLSTENIKKVEPRAPSQLRAISLSATSIQLQWKEESNGHSPILRYKLEYQNGTNKWERFPGLKIEPSTGFMVRNLRPNTGYRFRIRAINSIGYSLWSEPSAIITTHLQGYLDPTTTTAESKTSKADGSGNKHNIKLTGTDNPVSQRPDTHDGGHATSSTSTKTNGGGKKDEIPSKRTDSRDNVVSTGSTSSDKSVDSKNLGPTSESTVTGDDDQWTISGDLPDVIVMTDDDLSTNLTVTEPDSARKKNSFTNSDDDQWTSDGNLTAIEPTDFFMNTNDSITDLNSTSPGIEDIEDEDVEDEIASVSSPTKKFPSWAYIVIAVALVILVIIIIVIAIAIISKNRKSPESTQTPTPRATPERSFNSSSQGSSSPVPSKA